MRYFVTFFDVIFQAFDLRLYKMKVLMVSVKNGCQNVRVILSSQTFLNRLVDRHNKNIDKLHFRII